MEEAYLDGEGLLPRLDWLCIVSRVGSWAIITLASVLGGSCNDDYEAQDNKLMRNIA